MIKQKASASWQMLFAYGLRELFEKGIVPLPLAMYSAEEDRERVKVNNRDSI